MLLGIYNSAKLVSTNNNLRKFIHNRALESRLLDIIGKAEMEKDFKKTIKKIIQDKETLERYKAEFELDAIKLEKYIDSVLRETKKGHK